MKKNILTTVATATLFTGLALSSATAASVLCLDGNKSSTKIDQNITIDLKGAGANDVNLTLRPAAVYQGASFKLKFENGGLAENATHLLCVGDTKVGGLQEPGVVTGGVMTEPTFSFIDNDDVAALIQKDANITFETTTDCSTDGNTSEGLDIIGLAGKPCEIISAKIVEPYSTQGRPVPSLETNSAEFGKTKSFIRIACTPPECFVTQDKLKFTDAAAAPGVNVALTKTTPATPNHNSLSTSDCPECGEKNILTCTTNIIIENNNTDFNITGLDLVANFNNGKDVDNAAFKPVIDLSVDGNTTEKYTLGQKFSPSGLKIGKGAIKTITLKFTPNGTDMIEPGTIVADITGMDSNLSTSPNDVIPTFTGKTLATIKIGAKTQFKVPYMNGGVSDMVKISTRSDSETTLSADITDSHGKKCHVELDSIPGSASTMVFANTKAGRKAPYQNLIDAGECSELETKEYSVVFTTNAAVDVVSYMTMSNGSQRYVDVY